jgi:NAD(P)-dependent dehydrogenase (short-subunit alcohol dehydrogenase family)
MGDATVVNIDAWERDFRINVTSMMLMSRFAIPEMRKQGRGSIVHMSSVSGCKCLHESTWKNVKDGF